MPVTIQVPPEHHDGLLRVLLGLYGQKAERVNEAALAYLQNERDLAPLLSHRTELGELDSMLDQLGWRLNVSYETRPLTGEPHLLGEVVHARLTAVTEGLGEFVTDARGPADVERIERDLRQVRALLAAVREVHGTHRQARSAR
jgi:hypothetical protein